MTEVTLELGRNWLTVDGQRISGAVVCDPHYSRVSDCCNVTLEGQCMLFSSESRG